MFWHFLFHFNFSFLNHFSRVSVVAICEVTEQLRIILFSKNKNTISRFIKISIVVMIIILRHK